MNSINNVLLKKALLDRLNEQETITRAKKELEFVALAKYRFKFYIENEDNMRFTLCYDPLSDAYLESAFSTTSSVISFDNSKSIIGGGNQIEKLNEFLDKKSELLQCLDEVLNSINSLELQDRKIITYTYFYDFEGDKVPKKDLYELLGYSAVKRKKNSYRVDLNNALLCFAWTSSIYIAEETI